MRTILNLFLRVFVNEDPGEPVRGAVRIAGSGDDYPFRDEEELVHRLRSFMDHARQEIGEAEANRSQEG